AAVAYGGVDAPGAGRRAFGLGVTFSSPALLVDSCGPVFLLGFLAALIAWSYRLADRLEQLAASRLADDPAKRQLAARAARGEPSFGKLWLLAHLEHEPARRVLGARAPERVDPLALWVSRLQHSGADAARHAALAAGRALLPHLGPE